MRHFICPSDDLPRLCAIEPAAVGYTVVWTVFDFAEEKNLLSVQVLQKTTVDGFVSNVLLRLQKFSEVERPVFDVFLQQTTEISEQLTREGRPQVVWVPSTN